MAGKGRILVVDDDRLVLATLVHGLAQAGYEVIDADNGDDAILLAREHRPDLALLDIRMEGMSGFDVAETLRDKYRIPFMFLSAFSDDATVAQVRALGAVAYLVKPLDVGQIVPTVDDAFVRIRAGDLTPVAGPTTPPPAPPPATASATPPITPAAVTVPAPVPELVAVAVGIVMHRYSVPRDKARQRLQRLADEQGLSLATQAERVVLAVEELARTAD